MKDNRSQLVLFLQVDLLKSLGVIEPNSRYALLALLRKHFRRRLFPAFIGAYFLAGILQSSLTLGILLTILPAGFLVDKYGPRRLFLLGAVGTGSMSMTAPMIDNFPLLMAAVMLIGGFSSFAAASLNASFFKNLAKIGPGVLV